MVEKCNCILIRTDRRENYMIALVRCVIIPQGLIVCSDGLLVGRQAAGSRLKQSDFLIAVLLTWVTDSFH